MEGEKERENKRTRSRRRGMDFHGSGSWLGSGDDGPGTMMVRTPSCISAITLSTYFLVRETTQGAEG